MTMPLIFDNVYHRKRISDLVRTTWRRSRRSSECMDCMPHEVPLLVLCAYRCQWTCFSRVPALEFGTVTLAELMDAGILKPGTDTVSVGFKGTTFQASLLPGGIIEFQGTMSPSCHQGRHKTVPCAASSPPLRLSRGVSKQQRTARHSTQHAVAFVGQTFTDPCVFSITVKRLISSYKDEDETAGWVRRFWPLLTALEPHTLHVLHVLR